MELPPHHTYSYRQVPFQHLDELGQGSFARVDKVVSTAPDTSHGRVFARKVLHVPQYQKGEEVLKEMQITRALRHKHIVSVILTYEEKCPDYLRKTYGVVMEPVAEYNLKEYLGYINYDSRHTEPRMQAKVWGWFGCLASALAYMHDHRIRHKDVKPSNILVKGDLVVYSDFGTSKHMEDLELTTKTSGNPGQHTPMYCAPEVAAELPRGRKADVFSLGCVFVEMLTVLVGKSLIEFSERRGDVGFQAYQSNPDCTIQWLAALADTFHSFDVETVAKCCNGMLEHDVQKRYSSALVVDVLRDLLNSPQRQADSSWQRCSCLSVGTNGGKSYLETCVPLLSRNTTSDFEFNCPQEGEGPFETLVPHPSGLDNASSDRPPVRRKNLPPFIPTAGDMYLLESYQEPKLPGISNQIDNPHLLPGQTLDPSAWGHSSIGTFANPNVGLPSPCGLCGFSFSCEIALK
jgi:serine/threonine protein kinase